MLKKIVGAALAVMFAAAPAFAADEKKPGQADFLANLTGVSEYSFRGISQSDNNPAVQVNLEGAVYLNDYFTIYAGLFTSNVHFVPEVATNGASFETDLIGGLRGAVSGVGYDLKFIRYMYDAAETLNYDFSEFAGALNYDFGLVIPTVGMNYSPNFFGDSGEATYYFAGAKVPLPFLPYDARVIGNIGKQNIKRNATFGTPDYKDWNLGLYATFFGVDVGIQYVDTDLKKTECYGGGVAADLCKARGILSVGYTLTF